MMNEELEFVKKGNKTLLLPEGGELITVILHSSFLILHSSALART